MFRFVLKPLNLRCFWLSSLLLVAIQGVATTSSASSQTSQVGTSLINKDNIDGISILSPNTTGFNEKVTKLLDMATTPYFADIRDKSFVLVNIGSSRIWGFTVIYTYPTLKAPSGNPRRDIIRVSPGGPGASDRSLMEPGASYLVTPISSFVAAMNSSSMPTLIPPVTLLPDELRLYHQRFPVAAKDVVATLDSVIWEDGTISGSDSTHWLYKLNERNRAHQELAKLLVGYNGEGDIRKRLHTINTAAANDEFSAELSATAQDALAIIDEHGMQQASTYITSLSTPLFSNSKVVRRKE